jgi:hypothetical protein
MYLDALVYIWGVQGANGVSYTEGSAIMYLDAPVYIYGASRGKRRISSQGGACDRDTLLGAGDITISCIPGEAVRKAPPVATPSTPAVYPWITVATHRGSTAYLTHRGVRPNGKRLRWQGDCFWAVLLSTLHPDGQVCAVSVPWAPL